MEKIYKSTENLIGDCTSMAAGVDNYGHRTGSESDLMAPPAEVCTFQLGIYDLPRNRRPVSMFVHAWAAEEDQPQGYTSLPPDLINQIGTDKFEQSGVTGKLCWEAEDADDFIATLDESTILDIESLESIASNQVDCHLPMVSRQVTAVIDVHQHHHHHRHPVTPPDAYATVCKVSPSAKTTLAAAAPNICGVMQTSYGDGDGVVVSNSSEPPVHKIPKIMTASCYGGLNYDHNTQILFNEPTTVDIISVTNSIADEYSSMNSSMFEPNSLMSSVDAKDLNNLISGNVVAATAAAGKSEKGRVKWWDQNQFLNNGDEEAVQEIANQGK